MTDYAVGYRKPPKDKQFKPGQSGNPRGRPKDKLSAVQLFEKHLDAKIKVLVGHKEMLLSRREALIIGFISDALKGKDKVRKQLFDFILLLEAQNGQESLSDNDAAADDAVILGLLKQYGVDFALQDSKPAQSAKPKPPIKIKKSSAKENVK